MKVDAVINTSIPALIAALVICGIGLAVGLVLIVKAIIRDSKPIPPCGDCGHGAQIHVRGHGQCEYGMCRCPKFNPVQKIKLGGITVDVGMDKAEFARRFDRKRRES